jgi:hypothetical protein
LVTDKTAGLIAPSQITAANQGSAPILLQHSNLTGMDVQAIVQTMSSFQVDTIFVHIKGGP